MSTKTKGSCFVFDVLGGDPSDDECLRLARKATEGMSPDEMLEFVAGLVAGLIKARMAVVAKALFGQNARMY